MNGLKAFFRKHPRVGLLLFLLVASIAALPSVYDQSASVTLTWDLSSQKDLAGYRVYYGNGNNVHLINVNARQTKSFTIPDLEVGETYYFAISAYDADSAGEESDSKLILNILKEKNKDSENKSERH